MIDILLSQKTYVSAITAVLDCQYIGDAAKIFAVMSIAEKFKEEFSEYKKQQVYESDEKKTSP